MGLFDAFKKKKEDPKKEQSKKEEEFDLDKIDARIGLRTGIESNNKKNYEEQVQRVKEAVRGPIEEKELEEKQKELENIQKQYYEGTEQSTKDFFEYTNKKIERLERETNELIDNEKRIIADIDERIKQTDKLPGAQRENKVAGEQMKNILEEAKTEKETKSFEEKYKKISEVYDSLDLGIASSKFDKTQRIKYIALSKEQKDDILAPYLIEKIYSGLDDEKTKSKLKKHLRNKGEKVQEQYTSGVELLQALGLIEITDTNCFSASFKLYSLKTREEIKRQSELGSMLDDEKEDSSQKDDSNTK